MSIMTKYHRLAKGEFLNALEAVKPGLSPAPRAKVEHSNSFVIRNGRVETCNDEIACRMRVKLPKDLHAIVASKPLLAYLSRIKDDDIDVAVDEEKKAFIVKGNGRGSSMGTAFETTFHIDTVDYPSKDAWVKLSPHFGDAIGMVAECAGKDETSAILTCIHITDKYVEASDQTQWCRFRVKTPTDEPFLVKKEAVKHIATLDMTELAQTETWIHFRNPAGLVYSVRRVKSKFPPTDHLLQTKGKPLTLPKELSEAVQGVDVFASEDKDVNAIIVELEKGKLTLKGIGVTGKAWDRSKCGYAGRPLAFMIQPKMLVEIGKRSKDCSISQGILSMKGDRWFYVTELADPTAVSRAAEARASVAEQKKAEQEDE